MRLAVLLAGLFFLSSESIAQSVTKKDTTIILISDFTVQAEATEALNSLYNYDFEKAETLFRRFKEKYRWHPLPYFLMGLAEWWKIVPNPQEKKYDAGFLAYMDSSIAVSENLYKHYPEYKIEAAFFLAASYGFKGELYADVERKDWFKAAREGKAALKYMEVCREKANLSPELLFGDALYNYFREWVPENYKSLKPVFWLFRHGDKKLGLKQLKEVSYNAFYTRTEAMVWLMRILAGYENDIQGAFQIAEYLHQTYPNNPYFHRYYVRMLYSTGNMPLLQVHAKLMIQRIDSGRFGYEAVSGRYAAFFLAQGYEITRQLKEAKEYYLRAIQFSEEVKAFDSGYYLYSLISLGEIYSREGDKKTAKKYFNLVKKRAGRKDEAYKDAKQRLKKLEKASRD
ncbi:MAG: tol-pal system protein YbgF [Bacteroidetes bacterium]|nr:tol-pal system protein YbgF [Bacteroidota bacterium]MBS1540543.1 tol-pal system protein YbgF [Bacteroidota bacterium]